MPDRDAHGDGEPGSANGGRHGPDEIGPDETGPDEIGPDEIGPDEIGQRPIDTARHLVNELLAHDVRETVLAPGSRSGPLALALHAADRQGKLRLHVRIDEREAAFLALGMAKRSRRAVPVVTTSGTAVANVHPAMLEAHHAGVPLIAVTADRPARLRGTGANQTTEQRRIFGPIRFLDRLDELCGAWPQRAPVHLNLEFDEPLLTPAHWQFEPAHDVPEPAHGTAPESPGPRSAGFAPGPRSAGLAPGPRSAGLAPGPRTVVVAGDDAGPAARILARDAGWPLFAEPSSGARNGGALISYRLLLAHWQLAGQIERVISFGHATLSRPVTALLAREDVDVVHVGTQASLPVPAGPRVHFVSDVAAPPSTTEATPDGPMWLESWQRADRAVTAAVDNVLDTLGASPWHVARAVSDALPPGGLLVVGSSNPIRDLDLVAPPYPPGQQRYVMANRGLSGIDGTISTAVGAALTGPQSARCHTRALAYMGDLTFLHGSNGLLIGRDEPQPDLTIVVAADDGGSIFATLEQGGSEYAEGFERVFGTATGADIAAVCKAFGVTHRRVVPANLTQALAEPAAGVDVIEVPIDRTGRREATQRIAEAARAALARV